MIRKRLRFAMGFGVIGALIFALVSIFFIKYPSEFSLTSGGEVLIYITGIILVYMVVFVIFDVAGLIKEKSDQKKEAENSIKRAVVLKKPTQDL